MSVNLVSEAELRAALRPFRVDGVEFESGIRARLKNGTVSQRDEDMQVPSTSLSAAAAFLPLPLLAGGGAKLSALTVAQKLLGYIALPAVSLFVLVGAALFSAAKIRKVQDDNDAAVGDARKVVAATSQWWTRHKWSALMVFAAVIALPMIGSTWLLFLLLLVSFAALLCLLSSYVKLGVANRVVIGQSCLLGLVLLAQSLVNPFVGLGDIHFVDQKMITVVLFIGSLILLPFVMGGGKHLATSQTRRSRFAGHWLFGLLYSLVVGPMLIWLANPIFWPATPARIQRHVESFESFESSRFVSIGWRDWEVVASWTIDAGLDPDLSPARTKLELDLAKDSVQLSLVLGSAFRVGVVPPDQIERLVQTKQLDGFEKRRRSLIPDHGPPPRITSLNQHAWKIHALDQSGKLSNKDRDFLEQRLLATFDELAGKTADVLQTSLRVTQLLAVIDRPIDRAQHRQQVHRWLREFHSKKTHYFQIAGGFEQYKGLSSSLQTTAQAIALMKIYGVPDGLDLNWVRSYLRPIWYRPMNGKWIAAVTLKRLNSLPDARPPTWWEMLYYERSLIAAAVLAALCFYATLSSPKPVNDACEE